MSINIVHHNLAERKESHEHRQENARADRSLVSALFIATIAMVGLTLALHLGGSAVSQTGLTACSVGTALTGLGLIAAIASRCMGSSKPTRVKHNTDHALPTKTSVVPLQTRPSIPAGALGEDATGADGGKPVCVYTALS